MKPIGPEIKRLRKLRKVSPAAMAAKMKITKEDLNKIESSAKPTKVQIRKACKALDVPPSALAFFCVEKKDVPERKQELWDSLSPAIENMLNDTIKEK